MSVTVDERTLSRRDRTVGVLGPLSSSFTLAWLASHRGRLRTLLLGGRRLTVLVVWDRAGSCHVDHSEAELDAIRQLVYGEDFAKRTACWGGTTNGKGAL